MVPVADQLSALKRSDEERLLREQIVLARRRNLGPQHELTLNAEMRLAMCLVVLERLDEAEPLLAHVAASRTSMDSTDPDTARAREWYAEVLRRRGRLEEARHLQEQVLADYEMQGDPESDVVMQAASNLAGTLEELSEWEEASLLYRHVLGVRSRTLGPGDAATLKSMESLITVLVRGNHLREADAMATELVARCTLALGVDHPETEEARKALALIRREGGSWQA
jgi:tetratricopeptide (TPR) repeat protein